MERSNISNNINNDIVNMKNDINEEFDDFPNTSNLNTVNSSEYIIDYPLKYKGCKTTVIKTEFIAKR